MSGQLGQLVISLQADLARFQSDMGKAVKIADSSAKDIAARLGGVTDVIDRIGNAMAAATAILAGGAAFKAMVSETTAFTGEAVKLSRALGITTQAASVLNVALGDVYLTSDTLLAGSARLTRTLATNEKAFADFNIVTRNTDGTLRSTVDIMLDVNTHLGALSAGTERNVAGTRIYGKAWSELSGLLKLNNEVMKDAEDKARRLHLLVGPEGVEQVKKYKAAMNDLGDTFQGVKIRIGNAAIPALTEMAAKIAWFMERPAVQQWMQFASHPIDFTAKQAGMIGKPRAELNFDDYVAANVKPQVTLEARKAQLEAADRAKKEEAKRRQDEITQANVAAADAANELYTKYEKSFEGISKQLADTNPDLSEFDRKMASLYETVFNLSSEMPEYNATWNTFGAAMEVNIRRTVQIKQEAAAAQESIRTLSESIDGTENAFRMSGLSVNDLAFSDGYKQKFSLLDGGAAVGKQKFSLTGPNQKGWVQEVQEKQTSTDEMLKIEGKYNTQLLSMKMNAAEQSVAILRNMAGESKAMAIGMIVAQRALSIAQIMMNVEVAASAALLPPPVGLGPIAGQGLAASIRSMGYVSATLSGVAGLGEITNEISGKRASGGPVSAGGTYLIGEKGPELLTMGAASGYVTPNSAIGGASVTQHITIDARGADANVEQKIRAGMRQAKEEAKAEILNSMNRGGTFAVASGRR